MKLSSEERTWLDTFLRAIRQRFPHEIEQVIIYGSKARGDARPDSDLDVLVVLSEEGTSKDSIRLMGYELALSTDVVPSILVYTSQELQQRKRERSVFVEAVEREGVMVS